MHSISTHINRGLSQNRVQRNAKVFRPARMLLWELQSCLLMIPAEHIHAKTKVLTSRQHNHRLSLQYLLGCYSVGHRNHYMVDGCVRNHIHYQEREVQCFKRESLDQEVYQAGLSSIHIDAVGDVVYHSSMNANLHSLQPKKVGCLDKAG